MGARVEKRKVYLSTSWIFHVDLEKENSGKDSNRWMEVKRGGEKEKGG